MSRFESRKQRTSTKDKFISIINGGNRQSKREPWYHKKNMFLPLLMIFVFSFLAMALSVISTVNEEWNKNKTEEALSEELDYETAREILNSSGKEEDTEAQ